MSLLLPLVWSLTTALVVVVLENKTGREGGSHSVQGRQRALFGNSARGGWAVVGRVRGLEQLGGHGSLSGQGGRGEGEGGGKREEGEGRGRGKREREEGAKSVRRES